MNGSRKRLFGVSEIGEIHRCNNILSSVTVRFASFFLAPSNNQSANEADRLRIAATDLPIDRTETFGPSIRTKEIKAHRQ